MVWVRGSSGDGVEEEVRNGGCFCGVVRYAVAGEPESSSVCHCVSCRRASGAHSVAWLTFPAANFSPVSGEPVEYPSSRGVIRAHCGGCGTSPTYRHEEDAGYVDVTTAVLDLPDRFPPTHHTWLEDGVGWEKAGDGLARFQGGGPLG